MCERAERIKGWSAQSYELLSKYRRTPVQLSRLIQRQGHRDHGHTIYYRYQPQKRQINNELERRFIVSKCCYHHADTYIHTYIHMYINMHRYSYKEVIPFD